MSDIQDLTRMVNTLKRRVEEHEQLVRRPMVKQREPKKDRSHFLVEQTGPTSVIVHGGRLFYTLNVISLTSSAVTVAHTQTVLGLTVDSGTGTDYSGIKTISGITISGFIALEINGYAAPSALTVQLSISALTDAFHCKCLAYVTCADSKIVDVEQMRSGDQSWQRVAGNYNAPNY